MNKHGMRQRYFSWMCHLVCGNRYGWGLSWRKLFRRLHETEFIYILDMDANRANDGKDLRYRFAYESGWGNEELEEFLETEDRPCTMFEMMVALAKRCEETIMENPDDGDRTGKWFFDMIRSLGLETMDDPNYDENYVDFVLTRFMRREYNMHGQGGLFTYRRGRRDLRETHIWYQMMYYLDEQEKGGSL